MRKLIKKILKEDVDWIEDVPPEAGLRKYRIVYSMELVINAYDVTQAQDIYENLDLDNLSKYPLSWHSNEPGLIRAEWTYDKEWQVEDKDGDGSFKEV